MFTYLPFLFKSVKELRFLVLKYFSQKRTASLTAEKSNMMLPIILNYPIYYVTVNMTCIMSNLKIIL